MFLCGFSLFCYVNPLFSERKNPRRIAGGKNSPLSYLSLYETLLQARPALIYRMHHKKMFQNMIFISAFKYSKYTRAVREREDAPAI